MDENSGCAKLDWIRKDNKEEQSENNQKNVIKNKKNDSIGILQISYTKDI
jgi:hypothetical protein